MPNRQERVHELRIELDETQSTMWEACMALTSPSDFLSTAMRDFLLNQAKYLMIFIDQGFDVDEFKRRLTLAESGLAARGIRVRWDAETNRAEGIAPGFRDWTPIP